MKKKDENKSNIKSQKRKRLFLLARFILSAVFCLPLLYLAIVPMLWWISVPYPRILEPMQYPLSNALAQIALTLPILVLGCTFFFKGFKAFFKRTPNMDSLIAIGVTASIAYSLYSTYQIYTGNFAASDELYFVTAGAIITLALLGQWMESPSLGRAGKARAARLSDVVSGYFIPILLVFAVLAVGAWVLVGQALTFTLTVFLSILLIACPGAVSLAMPASLKAGARKGVKNSILINNQEAFETAHKVDIVVFGKSGTDTFSQNCASAVQQLSSMGIEAVLITGDDLNCAQEAARQARILKVMDGVPRQDWPGEIKKLQAGGKKVTMVVNGFDAGDALLQPDVLIAIGSGPDASNEFADIVLTRGDLMDVPAALRLCRSTMQNVKENLFWAFGYHVIGIPVAAGLMHLTGGPLMNPVLAAGAVALSFVSVIANTLRLKRFKPCA